MLVRILVGLDNPKAQKRVKDALLPTSVLISDLDPGESLWERLGASPFDLVVLSRSALSEPEHDSIRAILDLPGAPNILLMQGDCRPEERAGLHSAGVLAVLDPDLGEDALGGMLAPFVERRRAEAEAKLRSTEEDFRLGDFVTSSPTMGNLISIARRVATSDTTLLLLGETGVGKEWLARGIHAEGPRAAGPFVAVNCAAIPEGLFESQLFGHKRGAFTGANRDHRGHFEVAHGGTVFLDEIGDMPTQVQVKLLRVLQERSIQPVGSETTLQVNTRVMAATNRDAKAEIADGRLREDLYYRLAVVTMTVPALRDRQEDIPDLVGNYFEIFRIRLRKRLYGITREAMQALVRYSWPGNVRELINVMERAVLLCNGEELTPADFPEEISQRPGTDPGIASSSDEDFAAAWLDKPLRVARKTVTSEFERRYLTHLLRKHQGRVAETAKQAGMTPRALFDRMRQLDLRKEDFKQP